MLEERTNLHMLHSGILMCVKAILHLACFEHRVSVAWELHYLHIHGETLASNQFSGANCLSFETGCWKHAEKPENLLLDVPILFMLSERTPLHMLHCGIRMCVEVGLKLACLEHRNSVLGELCNLPIFREAIAPNWISSAKWLSLETNSRKHAEKAE